MGSKPLVSPLLTPVVCSTPLYNLPLLSLDYGPNASALGVSLGSMGFRIRSSGVSTVSVRRLKALPCILKYTCNPTPEGPDSLHSSSPKIRWSMRHPYPLECSGSENRPSSVEAARCSSLKLLFCLSIFALGLAD